jgi:hypothetical protein
MNEEFKKTIESLNRDIEADVKKLKARLQVKQVQDTLEPFKLFAAAIASLDADHIITEVNGIKLRAIDFQLLARILIESDN